MDETFSQVSLNTTSASIAGEKILGKVRYKCSIECVAPYRKGVATGCKVAEFLSLREGEQYLLEKNQHVLDTCG